MVSSFAAWSGCSKSCGTGSQSRSRSVVSAGAHGGYACPYLEETRGCNGHACAVHCVVSSFAAWSGCSKSCGAGSQSRSRSVVSAAAHGGYVCPYLEETRGCNAHACAAHCVVSSFGAWSTCSKSCTTGSQSRSRSVVTAAAHGGYACPYLEETRSCSHGACPIHCVTSTFGAWSTCTKSCGNGAQSRSRSVTTVTAHGGYVCPYLEETRGCNAAACAVDCVVTEYTAWSTCTLSCNAGTQGVGSHYY